MAHVNARNMDMFIAAVQDVTYPGRSVVVSPAVRLVAGAAVPPRRRPTRDTLAELDSPKTCWRCPRVPIRIELETMLRAILLTALAAPGAALLLVAFVEGALTNRFKVCRWMVG